MESVKPAKPAPAADLEAAIKHLVSDGGAALTPTVQDYAWGGMHYIAGLLGKPSRRIAELWMGAHAKSPSVIDMDGTRVTLDSLISHAPERLLGPAKDRLPYLFKLLDVKDMLSIQVHPNKEQAKEGFKRENELGVPEDGPNRNYKDDNHKPEMNLAVTEFWMLYGFKSSGAIEKVLSGQVPEFAGFLPAFQSGASRIGDLYGRIMNLSQRDADRILEPLIRRLERQGAPKKDSPDFWALRAAKNPEFRPKPDSADGYRGKYDRGIFSIYLLNLVHLSPGQGIDQTAGTLHAYLEGKTLEIMANSDNVLRGGLTSKHVDVPELLKTVIFESKEAEIINGEKISPTETLYLSGSDEFSLSKITVTGGQSHSGRAAGGAEILLVLDADKPVTVILAGKTLQAGKGGAFFVPFGAGYKIEAKGRAVLYRAMERINLLRG